MIRYTTIFDTQGHSKTLEAGYDSSTEPSTISTQHQLNQHFGASLSPNVSYTLCKDIKFVRDPAAQSMMEVYCKSGAKSWSDFVNDSTLTSFSQFNPQTFSVLSNFAIEYTKHIFDPLSQYNANGQLLKGSADKLVQHIHSIYSHLKQRIRNIPSDCCLQLELRSILEKSPRPVQETKSDGEGVESELEEDEEHDMKYQMNSNNNNCRARPVVSSIESVQAIDDILRKCILSLNEDHDGNYKRYEMVLNGSEITPFETNAANTIPSCAYNNGHFCTLYNSTSTASEMMKEFGNDKNAMITTSFQAYHDRVDAYFYINDVNCKLFGQRIFKDDLLSTLPLLFEANTIDKEMEEKLKTFDEFGPDEIYKKYAASILQQNIVNVPNEHNKSLSSLGVPLDYKEDEEEEEEIIKNLDRIDPIIPYCYPYGDPDENRALESKKKQELDASFNSSSKAASRMFTAMVTEILSFTKSPVAQYYADIISRGDVSCGPYIDKMKVIKGYCDGFRKIYIPLPQQLDFPLFPKDLSDIGRIVEMVFNTYRHALNEMSKFINNETAATLHILTFPLTSAINDGAKEEKMSDDDENDQYEDQLDAFNGSTNPSPTAHDVTTHVLNDDDNDVFRWYSKEHKPDYYPSDPYQPRECRFDHIEVNLQQNTYQKYPVQSITAPYGIVEGQQRGYMLLKAADLYGIIRNSMQFIFTSMMEMLYVDAVVTTNDGTKLGKRIMDITEVVSFLGICFDLSPKTVSFLNEKVENNMSLHEHGVRIPKDLDYIKFVSAHYGQNVSESFRRLVCMKSHHHGNDELNENLLDNFDILVDSANNDGVEKDDDEDGDEEL